MRELIADVCNEIGPRAPCSDEEKQFASYLKQKLDPIVDRSFIEEFETSPLAYKMAFKIPMILYILSCISLWFFPILALIMAAISFLILFGEMAMALEVFSFLFPKKKSVNYFGKIYPKNEDGKRKQVIILGSHLDSNWEFPLFRKLGVVSTVIIAFNVLLHVFFIVFSIIILISSNIPKPFVNDELIMIQNIILSVGIIPALLQLFFMISNIPVMGANDNLSGVAISCNLAKFFADENNNLINTELWICAFGCEEIGSKGSKAFIKKHWSEIKNAVVIVVDMVGNKNAEILLGTSEVFGTVRLSTSLIERISENAQRLQIPVKQGSAVAFTDSLSFARAGVKTASILSFPNSFRNFCYHTREDVIENLDFSNLNKVYELLIPVIKSLDKNYIS